MGSIPRSTSCRSWTTARTWCSHRTTTPSPKLDPAELETLKTDPAALSKLDYYHAFLGLVGPDLVQGVRPSQEGTDITIKGKGGDIKVNDSAKVICGGISGVNSRIYIIDTVLDPASGGSLSSEERVQHGGVGIGVVVGLEHQLEREPVARAACFAVGRRAGGLSLTADPR